jgi:hypothetical protein
VYKRCESVEKLGRKGKRLRRAGVCLERFRRLLKAYFFRDLSVLCESQLGAQCWRLLLSEVT